MQVICQLTKSGYGHGRRDGLAANERQEGASVRKPRAREEQWDDLIVLDASLGKHRLESAACRRDHALALGVLHRVGADAAQLLGARLGRDQLIER